MTITSFPTQKGIALVIPHEFDIHVLEQRVVASVEIDRDRVIDHQIHRHERVDRLGLTTEAHNAIAHRREVDNRRHARRSRGLR